LLPLAAILNVPLRCGGCARLLNNGDAYFHAMLDDFRAAQHTINFMVYIWEPGRVSDQIFEALIQQARAGVQVRVLLDGFGGLLAPRADVERLRESGGKVAIFRPPQFGKLLRYHRRNHRRAIVIDGRIAYTGGAAVGDKWIGDARNAEEWRDTLTRVTGCLAQNVQSAFAEPWAYCTGEVLTGDAFFPPDLEDDHTDFARQLEQTFQCDLEECREIDPAEWRRRGAGKRIVERLCVLFAEQY
jgi:cardiolipin synthase